MVIVDLKEIVVKLVFPVSLVLMVCQEFKEIQDHPVFPVLMGVTEQEVLMDYPV